MFFLGENEDGVCNHPEWMRTPFNIEQDVISPNKVKIKANTSLDEIDSTFVLDDGSITEITQFTDLMCKGNIGTEIYVVSKTFPYKGYSLTQNFRKMQHDQTGIETYVRGECIEYKLSHSEFIPRKVQTDISLEETLATYHIQRKLTSRILFLSKPLKKRGDLTFPSVKKNG